jgi:DNA-binding response OmpR family regulator
MKRAHLALIVEDDKEIGDELREILNSLDCNSVTVSNTEDALRELQKSSFCLVLLDLNIKADPDAIKGHVEHGKSLLRKIRQEHSEHIGTCFWLPILVISGFAREWNDARELMKDNASDIIQKPFDSQVVSRGIRQALIQSGRQTHGECENHPIARRDNFKDGVVITIPGDRFKRRTAVRLGSQALTLTDSSLRVFLHLVVAHMESRQVHKTDLGATNDQGFKGISILRNELKQVLGTIDIIKNHYYGNYSFEPDVTIGECAVQKLIEIGDRKISDLARRIKDRSPLPQKKPEGNSESFPTQRRRR